MYDILEKIFAVLIAVVLMFFFPLLDVFERMDDLSFMTVYASTVKFVDTVRNTGRITPELYFEFKQILDATGNRYNVEIIHRHLSYYPELDIENYENEYSYVELFDEVYTEQMLVLMGIMIEENGEIIYNTDLSAMQNYEDFAVGDYFYVCVKNTEETPATVIKNVLYGANLENVSIIVPYGGMIRNIPIDL